ncbi:hypothetical protein GCM10009087_20730 [Sphingomonas oligophenolica]|uniref:VOC family protein n=1 Tax=Sphingomonas oligophenolica TaxID=301154 RepID=A0ABU9Y3Y7_9SPHN
MIRPIWAAALLFAATPCPAQAQSAASATPVQASLMAPGLRVADIDRSIVFYGIALGLVPATTLRHGPLTEVMLCADGKAGKLALILMHDATPGTSPPIELGNGVQKIVMRVPDLAGVANRMKAAGYPVGDVHWNKGAPSVLMIKDPDGYSYELVGSTPHG